ncbi:MAG: ATP-dependent RNA helicase HrpA [Lentisphaerae bacterium]|nr:ATP-dependent RNA helicase HrpA [Lentisphaerota bacterium]
MNEALPVADTLKYTFPEELPISARADEIAALLQEKRIVIVCGATGSGKTTQLPKIALKAGCGRHGRIGCTQPRRIAASSLCKRVSSELNVASGGIVGYKVRFDDNTTKDTLIKFMTDGILLAETREDRLLRQYDCIILDEVHERTLNIDFLLGCLKLIMQKRNDLKLIVSSATLESGRISEFFDGAPVVEVEGRTYPVEDVWLPPEEETELPETVADGVKFLTDMDPRGDILVFLPGEREIRECTDMLRGRGIPQENLLPLFGRLSSGEQQRVFSPSGHRRIILATNVAETSLTIPGIRYVVDTGLVRLSRYNPRSRIQELRVETVSKASSMQRRGRCGRTRDGICVHLYSEEDFQNAADFTPPEIQRASLAGVILQMASLNLPPLGKFPLVDEPAPALIREGYRALDDIGAVAGPDHRITKLGRLLSSMPVDPHLGKMLLEAKQKKVLPEMLVIAAFLSIQDPAERPFEKAAEADGAHRKFASDKSDFLGILTLWNAIRKAYSEANGSYQAIRRFAKTNYYNYRRLREWENLVDDLNDVLPNRLPMQAKNLVIELERVSYDALHTSILSGIPRNLSCFEPEQKLYSDMASKKFIMFPGSGMAKRKNTPKWLMFFSLMETSRVFSRCNAEAKPEWLEQVAPQLCSKVYDAAEWDQESGFVYAREKIRAGALLIHPGRRRHYGAVNPVEARKIFIQQGLATGLAYSRGTWLEKFSKEINRLRDYEIRLRRPDSLVQDVFLEQWFEEHLPEHINSTADILKDWIAVHKDYAPDIKIMLEEAGGFDPKDYPDFLVSSGERFKLKYKFDPGESKDGLFLLVPDDNLNLLDRYLPDYLVPGMLQEKVEFLLKTLPKMQRLKLNPLRETAEFFALSCQDGTVFTDQPLTDALSGWLEENYDVRPEFDPERLPEHLVMKLAILNENGKISKILREYPSEPGRSSALGATVSSVKKWSAVQCKDWPGDFPQTVNISGKSGTIGYPALTAEALTVGTRVFLKECEAIHSQRQGLVKLFSILQPGLMKQLRSGAKLPGNILMTFFMEYKDWQSDAADNAVLKGFGCPPESIHSEQLFRSALERARGESWGCLEKDLLFLKEIFSLYEKLLPFYKKLRGDSDSAMEIKAHLKLLFRPGFLRFTEALEHYPRYLKALSVRAQRASNSLASDAAKGVDLKPWIEKQRLALEMVPAVRTAPGLVDFFLLVEEAKINRYAPEIRTLGKTGTSALEKAWNEVRLG